MRCVSEGRERHDGNHDSTVSMAPNGQSSSHLLIIFGPCCEPVERGDSRADEDEPSRHWCTRIMGCIERFLKTANDLAQHWCIRTIGDQRESKLVFVEAVKVRRRRRIAIHGHAEKIHDGGSPTRGIFGVFAAQNSCVADGSRDYLRSRDPPCSGRTELRVAMNWD